MSAVKMEEARCDGLLGELDDGLIELAVLVPHAGGSEAESELLGIMSVHSVVVQLPAMMRGLQLELSSHRSA